MSTAPINDTIDLRSIFRKLVSKWWLFLITTTIALALALAYLKTTPKQYAVQAVLLMSEKSRNSFGGGQDEFLKGVSYLRSSTDIEDQISVLTSRTNITKTLQRMELGVSYFETDNFLTVEKFEYPPFHVKLDTLALQVTGVPIHVKVDRSTGTYRVKAKGKNVQLYNVQKQEVMDEFIAEYEVDQTVAIGKPFVAKNLGFRIEFPEDRDYGSGKDQFFHINTLEGLVSEYRGKVLAEPLSDKSNIVVLNSKGQVVEKERAFLNKLMETYIEGELYKQNQKGIKTINFIDGQIGSVSDSLKQVESSMEGFRGTSGGMMSATGTSDQLFQERSRLEDERSTLMRRRSYCQSVLEKIRSSSDLRNVPAPSSSGIDDPILNNLVIEITKLSADLAALNLSTVKSNPTVIAMERKMKNLSGSLAQTAESLVQQAEISLAEVNRRLGRIGYEFNQLPENERKLGNIERKFKLSESLYNYLMEKRAEAGIAIASDQVDKVVVDEARRSGLGPVAPDKKVVLGGALLLGLLLPMGFIIVRDFFNDRITDAEELKRLSPLPLLAMIPNSKRKRILPDEPKSMLAESFRTARINLQYLNVSTQRQVIGFTSSSSGEGKTFCALNLATVMALSGKRTLLLDADMRRPRVATALELPEGAGLSTYLIGEAGLDAIVRRSDIAGLDVITAGPIPPNPLELVEHERIKDLFAQLRGRYDQIIVDASPMGLVSEYVILLRHVDVSLYVVREGYTRRGALRLIGEMYKEKKITNVDLLLNDVKPGQGYGEGYGYYTK
ncbi:MAG: polysaccharide biosynthesis tyrosine autokinase [Flavobacteriales bacterium]|jgi:capsular exopolysaccharide synthesis family protein|nr:polysaccharide biosynthesis tyrosine autokinase [Flavobacteriales bacterium]MBP7449128.1 polysaccharide biosynthesis tyrosine autokinase [Flavobacteriales bacterium]HOZ39311.1 polysaccharide biosynthesis tyrosine autokinase [Flavobacteriales bacterium]